MGIAKPSITERGQSEEEAEGARRARAARTVVAAQTAQTILTTDLTGSTGYVALRVRNLADAERSGDHSAIRAAAVELAAASGSYAAQIDLRGPTSSLNGAAVEAARLINRAGGLVEPQRGKVNVTLTSTPRRI